jgi:RNA polymerase sigma-70 factor, ECF subfamily
MINLEAPDEDLVAIYVDATRSRSDREGAFHLLVRRYERRVFGICVRELRSRTDAEDATQDTFLNLARRADQFRGDSQWSTFVYRVAINACRDLQRRQARRPQTPVEDVAEAQLAAGLQPDTTPDEAEGHDTALAVQAALEHLDELSRTLIVLCAIEGMSYPEAAQILDMPVGTIKSRVFRARAQLADLLADHRDGAVDDPDPVIDDRRPPHTLAPRRHGPRGPPA